MITEIAVDRHRQRLAFWLVVAGVGFNLALCFISTNLHSISEAEVTACEIAILATGALTVLADLDGNLICAAALLTGWLLAVHIIDPALGQTAFVALAIPVIYVVLGQTCGTPRMADRLVLILSVVALVVGLVEMTDLSLYERYLNVLNYYINKGGLKLDQAHVTGTHFFVSGIRPAGEGRSLLPVLGDHRASSIFLEPISLGNFAVICAAWGLVRFEERRRFGLAMIAIAVVNAVLADSRQGISCVILIAAALATPLPRSPPWRLLAPVCVLAALLYIGWEAAPRPIDDTLGGRIYGAGTLMASWGARQWFGVAASSRSTVDCGYAQLLMGLGIVPAFIAWAGFALWRTNNRLFNRYRCALIIYLCVSLTITGSVLSIKTGALAWFLLGSAEARSNPARRRLFPPTISLARPSTI